ncbi:MAG TPA: response regulator, partial [Opitutaceae bacterium]|nr:response regulator [Opitutaceae bacterium]
MGYRIESVTNGHEVLSAVARQSFDLIFMDVQMPEMDGLEATRRLCAGYSTAVRPWIVAMTANAMEGDRETCLAAGMDDYISKPIRGVNVAKALQRAWEQIGKRRPLTTCSPSAVSTDSTPLFPIVPPSELVSR